MPSPRLKLYGYLRKQSGNLFFSPESISTALAMAYAGARGDTASRDGETLHFCTLPAGPAQPGDGCTAERFQRRTASGFQLGVANALWAQRGYDFLNSFLNIMNNDLRRGVETRWISKARPKQRG